MSGSPSIDPRQAGRFDISRFRERRPIYVTHRHIVHLAAAIGTRFGNWMQGSRIFERGARRSDEGSSSSRSWQICGKRKLGRS